MRKDFNAVTIILIVAIIAFIAIFLVIIPNLPQNSTSVRIGDGIYKARLALTPADREKGLSGVTSMSDDQALLMVYPELGKWGIWMKGMKVPIDIVWLDEQKKVIYIVKNVTPDESTELVTYEPKDLAKYVLELPAGTVDSKAITTGSAAIFQIEEGEVE